MGCDVLTLQEPGRRVGHTNKLLACCQRTVHNSSISFCCKYEHKRRAAEAGAWQNGKGLRGFGQKGETQKKFRLKNIQKQNKFQERQRLLTGTLGKHWKVKGIKGIAANSK